MHCYPKRSYVYGNFVIASYPSVSDEAHYKAKYILERMVTPQQAADLHAIGSALVIVPLNEKLTQCPGFEFLADQCATGDRDWNSATDGCGGTTSLPVTTIFERHLIRDPSDPYKDEDILVHEFAHHFMNLWIQTYDPEAYRQIHEAYENALKSGQYSQPSYITSTVDEYFAESAQLYFNATKRTDDASTGGMTRDRHPVCDGHICCIIQRVFQNGQWDCINDPVVGLNKSNAGWTNRLL